MKAVVGQYEFEPGCAVEVRYGAFDPRDCRVRSVDGFKFGKGGKCLLPPHAPAEALSAPPTDLHELFALAEKMATELKRQHAGDSGKKALGEFFRLQAM